MSNYLYLTCLEHDPRLMSHDEVSQHAARDIDNVRAWVRDRKTLVALRRDHEGGYDDYFLSRAIDFLGQHETCAIGGYDEEGRTWDMDVDPTVGGLTRMPLEEILTRWRPGSHPPPWGWTDEARDLFTRDLPVTAGVMQRVIDEGIDFGNDYGAHICLGSDGRVWDGHHRLVVARALGIPYLTVDIAVKGSKS